MSEESFDRLAYALYKGLQSFNQGLEEYENKKECLNKDFLLKEMSIALNQAIIKYNISFDTVLNSIFPKEYQPILIVFKRMRVDELIDMLSEIAEEYAKDKDGKYKSLDETLIRVAGKNFLKKIFGGQNG